MRSLNHPEAPRKHASLGASGNVLQDPAPSRLSYRLNRIWLTPFYRKLILRWIPAVLLALIPIWWFSDADRRSVAFQPIKEIGRSFADRPEFSITALRIEGAPPSIDQAIRESFPYELPISSFDLDQPALRETLSKIDGIEQFSLRLLPGGHLNVEVKARQPELIYYSHADLSGFPSLIDRSGTVVAEISEMPALALRLPHIAGEGAPSATEEALAIHAALTPVRHHIAGLVRIGERRWDLVTNRSQRILLPEKQTLRAVDHLIALEQTHQLLSRDISHIDMRLPDRVTLRLANHQANETEQTLAHQQNQGGGI